MKPFFISVISLLLILCSSCGSSENSAEGDDVALSSAGEGITVMKATSQDWSGSSPVPSGGRERGTDLVIYPDQWPEAYSPDFVVFRGKRSFPARAEGSGSRVEIHARIIHESSLLMEVSEEVVLSDRLVYTDEQGETGYIEIEEWEWVE